MKKSLIFKSLIVLFSIISFVSCETEPLDPDLDLSDFQNPVDPNNPNNPNNGAGNFTATIDGVGFNSTQTIGDYSDSAFGNELNLFGITNEGKIISLQIINPAVGTFQAGTTNANLVLFQYSDATLGSNGFFSSINSSNNTSTGSITITEFNTTANKISATFSFTAYNSINPLVTKQVTQGVINNVSFDNQVTVTPPPPSGIVGTYLMTAFNISEPQDLNGDGTTSINQMNETSCFNNNTLIINSDNTFSSTSKGLDINIDGPVAILECYTDPTITGTWSQNGNNVTFTYVDGGQTYTDIFVLTGNTLTMTIPDGEVVGSASGGEPVYLTADISVIYTKQ